MARSCAYIPRVKNKNDEKVASKLFKDLLALTSNDRVNASKLWYRIHSEDFKSGDWYSKLALDENNEPTLRSLIKETNIMEKVEKNKLLETLNRKIGHYKKGQERLTLYVKNRDNYRDLQKRVDDFNDNSPFRDKFAAKISQIQDSETGEVYINPEIEERNQLNSIEENKFRYNRNLNEKLRAILEKFGISVGTLTDLEERRKINGVADFDVAKDVATGLIELIRLAKGERGEKALPEEFSHVIIEAMNGNPLTTRLLNFITNNNLIPEILEDNYETYKALYNEDVEKLAKEAAGKLLAKHLLQQEEINSKPYKNILQRFIEAVKDFFKKFNTSDIQKAMYEADKNFGTYAKQILEGSLDNQIDIDNINGGVLYSTDERIQRDKKVLNNIIANELKRLKIYEQRSGNSKFSDTQREFINDLELKLATNEEIEGIYEFLDTALKELEKVKNRLVVIAGTEGANLNTSASVLRDVRNYIFSYKRMLDFIREATIDEEKYADNRYGTRMRVVLDNTTTLLNDVYAMYNKTALPIFVDFLKPYIGDSLNIPFGKTQTTKFVFNAEDKGVEEKDGITIINLAKVAPEDIGFFDRWLDAMAESKDTTLRLLDNAVKTTKEDARLDTINDMKELQALHMKLEQAGIKTTDFMFERDNKGNLTGRYLSEINVGQYRKDKKEFIESLEKKYGKNPVGEDAKLFIQERKKWVKDHTEDIGDGNWRPKKSLYTNKAYTNLNTAQKEYYDGFMKIKAKLDSYLPVGYTKLENTVKIRKDLLERVKSSKSVIDGTKQLWESIKDDFIRRSDDVDLGVKHVIKDFEEREVQLLPVYYTRMAKGENPNDISTDATSTLIAYAAMANDYHQMNKIIDALELSRDMLRERKIIQKAGNKNLMESFEIMGRKVGGLLTKQGSGTNTIKRLDDFFEMQVYQRYMKDEGSWGKIDKGKAANFVNKMTALNTYALNILSGISNVATGNVMMHIEGVAAQFFNEGDIFKADKIYAKELTSYLGEISNRVKTSKLALWDELFNVMQEYEQNVRDSNFDRKIWISRMFNSSALYLLNNAGEHWMQNRTSLALASAYKMKSPGGKEVSLWEAMEVVYKDKNNKKLGAKLQVKQGYTKLDGSAFTTEDIKAFSRRSKSINQRMHGIYNKADRNAFQRLAIGRMAMMFRKWMRPSYNRRFQGAIYNYDLKEWTEGYYRTTGRFALQLIKELKEHEFALVANWKNLKPQEKQNIKRALFEMGTLLATALVLAFIDWPDDEDRPWLISMAEYQTRRLFTELGSMTPGPQLLDEALKVLKSPAAGINVVEKGLDILGLFNPYNYETFGGEDAILQSGRYKGESRATKLFYESPLLPMNKTIYRGLHPEEGIPFFKQ